MDKKAGKTGIAGRPAQRLCFRKGCFLFSFFLVVDSTPKIRVPFLDIVFPFHETNEFGYDYFLI